MRRIVTDPSVGVGGYSRRRPAGDFRAAHRRYRAYRAARSRPAGQVSSGVARPDWKATTTSWARSFACSLLMARLTWVRAVAGLITSRSAIASLDNPSA